MICIADSMGVCSNRYSKNGLERTCMRYGQMVAESIVLHSDFKFIFCAKLEIGGIPECNVWIAIVLWI